VYTWGIFSRIYVVYSHRVVASVYFRKQSMTEFYWYQSLSLYLMWVTTYINTRAFIKNTTIYHIRTNMNLDLGILVTSTRISLSFKNSFVDSQDLPDLICHTKYF